MNINTKNTNKKPLKALFGSTLACTATLASGLFAFGATNLNAVTNTPNFVNYLQRNWNWNGKLEAKIDATTWGNKWATVSGVYKEKIPFMQNDYVIAQAGTPTKDSKFNNQFISAFANFGLLTGVAYQAGQTKPFYNNRSFYLYYPLLGINQIGLVDADFVFTTPKTNDTLINVLDSQNTAAPKFHYSIELTGTAVNTPVDQTTMTIKKYDDGKPATKTYTQAVIKASPTKANPATTYTPILSTIADAANAFAMKGSDFTVTLTKGTDTYLSASPTLGVYHTHTDSYALRNMFAFFMSETDSKNVTTQQLLGIDTTALLNGTDKTINTKGLDYIAQYSETANSLSTGAIIGIAVGSAALLALVVGLGVWLYKRHHHQTTTTNK